jgi:hypothetical protein
VIAALILTAASATLTGCARSKPIQKSNAPPIVGIPAREPPVEVNLQSRSFPEEPQLLEGSGIGIWANHYPGVLIAGLDGAMYAPYRPSTLQRVQRRLRERGLYAGPVNGILDGPTMKSIYAFQEANNLQRSGVPTPHTRKMLEQGSHTDLRFTSRTRRIGRG